jgi:3-phosphoshikimate 1-carboxyvinyltransferase
MEYDFTGSPDLAQTFVVACALMNVPFRFTGLQTLKIKETDRIEALKCEMRKLGYVIHDVTGTSDGYSNEKCCELIWDGERCEPDFEAGIDTYEDHRMALAFAPAAFMYPVIINNPQVVSKSYPHFWDDLRQAGFKIEEL